ncbi:MAG: hypothetical protein A2149_09725 [Candidatus Schekmanbacteria bacterium RBG_16_38_11]|uniref:Uncharacterized protein n=1 Tax=Candidatus Schekmanbacteria bacterium RBG_16_38_11 TaxID=1817880 RepID=A0A1F7RXE8_9BACT|nr:MAG: hypothetical protein A2149_09725 [Candidatus Schekmanbacteria bacterium RBG_16_38_11]
MKIRPLFCAALILILILFISSDKTVQGTDRRSGSILTVDSITAKDFGDNDEMNVDAFRTDDCDGDLATKDPEGFSDLFATITISNSGRPNFTPSTSQTVKIYQYTVSFTKLGGKNIKKLMPRIKPFIRSTSLTIQPDSSGDLKIVLLTKAMKEKFVDKYIENFGEDPRDPGVDAKFLSYTAHIKIYGKEVPFNNKVDTSGDINITITEVDNCSTTTP